MGRSKLSNHIVGASGGPRPMVNNLDTGKHGLAGDPQFAKASDNFKEISPEKTTADIQRENLKKSSKRIAKGDLASPVNPPLAKTPAVRQEEEEEDGDRLGDTN